MFVSLFSLINNTVLFAQIHNLRFAHITKDDGLSQNIVNCIYQDSKGFIWIGTNEGLNKYDGYNFSIFEKGIVKRTMLSDDVIQSIVEDNSGNLWIGTQSGGINIFNRKTDNFTYLNLDSIQCAHADINNIKSIQKDQEGNFWFIAGNAIVKMKQDRTLLNYYIPEHLSTEQSKRSNLTTLFLDSDNNLWFGTIEDGLGFLDITSGTLKYYKHLVSDKTTISDNNVRAISEDKSGVLWIGTYNGGLNLFNRDKQTFSLFLPNPETRESFTIKSIIEDKNGNLWLGTRDGLYIFNRFEHSFNHFTHDMYNPFSLSNNNIQAIYGDRNENIWLGTKRGVNLLKKRNMKFKFYRTDPNSDRCLNSSHTTSIFEDSYGKIWFGTTDGGLNMLNRKTGRFKYFKHDSYNIHSISSNNVTDIVENSKDNLWIGTMQGGLNLFDYATKRFYHFLQNPEQPLVLQSTINSLLFISKNLLLLITDNGLITFDINKKKFERVQLSVNSHDINFTRIIKGDGDFVWLGTGNTKILKLNLSTLETIQYQLPTTSKITRVNAMLLDGDNLWIGTSGGGLFCFNEKQKMFSVYKRKDGLPNMYITGLLKDNHNNIWVSTYDGLVKFIPSSKKFFIFYEENGIQNNQFTIGSLKSSTGELFFGDIDGAISFKPEEISTEAYKVPVVFTDFKIFNKPVPIDGENPILLSDISEAKKVSLTYNMSSFTFTFAALDYTMSDKIQYSYIMEGFEKNWNNVGNRRYATYTNLDPGNYIFKVKAANNIGQCSEKSASIVVFISPPYWETWWFQSILLVTFVLIIWFFSNYIIQKRKLLRATALANITQLKLLRNQMNPHFLLNTFNVVRALVLIDKDKAWEMISRLSEFFRYMLLNYSREEDSLSEEIEAAKNYISIQKECFHESLEVRFNINPKAQQLVVPSFIFQPLIENAIKYGANTSPNEFKINVRISYENNILTIDIANTGKLVKNDKNKFDKEYVHGTSIKNIKKRLGIMFKDRFTIELSENNGWVHAIIRIEYIPKTVTQEYAQITSN